MFLNCSVGTIHCIAASVDGQVMCSTAEDKSLKVFDVVNFGKNVYSYSICSFWNIHVARCSCKLEHPHECLL